ncbi:putative oxidoreductase CzcO [Heyndrickxia sporothermodurans]|nr:putative oxidoreductase CzcO [Heyndrickxia sporothermodurans]
MIYDVIVIGAGQAGLSMGYYLKNSSLSFVILEKNIRIGDVWKDRYDSLTLFTPRSHSSLPGLALEGNPDGLPTKNEIGNYLENYANIFKMPVKLDTIVKRIDKREEIFVIYTKNSTLQAKNVVIATGPFHKPKIPSFSKDISQNVVQLHSSAYKNPSQLKGGAVLVVGGGNSGSQIAAEVSQSHLTYLSVSQNIRFLPLSIANKSIFWWFDKLGILKAKGSSFIGSMIQKQSDPIFGYELKDKVKNKQVTIKGRTSSVQNDEIIFNDRTRLKVNNIIWATGFVPDYSWINIPQLMDTNGNVKHERGITKIKGLYFLGLPWQYCRGSALLFGVGDDAEYLSRFIVNK